MSDHRLLSLMTTALGQTRLRGLSEVLRTIAQSVGAEGCILWKRSEISEREDEPAHFFVLAQWFRTGARCRIRRLPATSVTGRAIGKNRLAHAKDVETDPHVFRADPFLAEAGIKSFVTAPVGLSTEMTGSLNTYRGGDRPFSAEEIAYLEQIAPLLPSLYQVIGNKVSGRLVERVSGVLHRAEQKGPGGSAEGEAARRVARRVCVAVSGAFECIETSLFLSMGKGKQGEVELAATTLPRADMPSRYNDGGPHGPTCWALVEKRSLRILDLARFDDDREAIVARYPGLSRGSLPLAIPALRERLALTPEQEMPPLSFMAAPILAGDKAIGVLRCAVVKRGPYGFSERDLRGLEVVSAHIGRWWTNWLSRWEVERENRAYRALVANLGELNGFVHAALRDKRPDEALVFDKALRLTAEVIGGADNMDLRLADEKEGVLRVVASYHSAQAAGSEAFVTAHEGATFPIAGTSIGAHVHRTWKAHEVTWEKGEDAPETFGAKHMITVPLGSEHRRFGVLDVRTTRDEPFPTYARIIAELAGQQLGLYHDLALTLAKAKEAESAQATGVRQQIQAFQDLKHQLKSPIIQAHQRVQAALTDANLSEESTRKLLVIRGLCGKTKRVTLRTGLFADLASDTPIRAKQKRLDSQAMVKMLIEAAQDHELLAEHPVRFTVDRATFEAFRPYDVRLDPDLFEQAVGNLLDNAAKYSYPRTVVRIFGGFTGKDRMHVSVSSTGLPIRGEDLKWCKERGWRSDEAKWTTGEGSGIGLWIVDHIMRAHQGEVVIVPDGTVTEVKLIFPKPTLTAQRGR